MKMTISDIILYIIFILLGFLLGYLYYDYKYATVTCKDDKYLYNYMVLPGYDDPPKDTSEKRSEHFFDYDLSKQDFVITGDRHADTIEKSFSKNNVKHSEEYWKYTFEDGGSEKSDHPLSNEEMKPLVNIHGPVKQDGLEVIKL